MVISLSAEGRLRRAARAALLDIWRNNRDPLIETFQAGYRAIDHAEADVVFLGARGATAFHHLLRLAGQAEFHRGRVLSDRFIALEDRAVWEGQRAWLIDDRQTYGQAKQRLKKAAGGLCGEGFIVGDDVHVALDSKRGEGNKLHEQYALALGRACTPLFADFPITCEITVSAQDLVRLTSAEGLRRWDIANVTNTVVAPMGGRSYSIFPHGGFLRGFQDRVGTAASLIRMVKLRVFAFAQGRTGYRLRLVPMVLLNEQPIDVVRRWLIDSGLPNDKDREEQPGPALALMGYLLSRVWLDYVSDELGGDWFGGQPLVEDLEFTRVAMSEVLSRAAGADRLGSLQALQGPTTEDLREPVFDLLSREVERRLFAVGDSIKGDGRVGADELVAFLDTVRRLLPETEPAAPEKAFKTLAELAVALSAELGHREVGDFTVSLALDVLNDLGHAVPVLRTRDGKATRGYRRGEKAGPIDTIMPGKYSAFQVMDWAWEGTGVS
jgi:hypothetical protein